MKEESISGPTVNLKGSEYNAIIHLCSFSFASTCVNIKTGLEKFCVAKKSCGKLYLFKAALPDFMAAHRLWPKSHFYLLLLCCTNEN